MRTTIHKVSTVYKLILSFYNKEEQTLISSWVGKTFDSIDEAKIYWRSEFKDRKKNDEYDEYYNNVPFAVECVTTVSIIMVEN